MSIAFNVWTPSGVIFSGTDVGNPQAIWDTGPAVLVGPTSVMKLWYGNFGSGKLSYAESADGLTSWTAYSGNPITVGTGCYFPSVWKQGSTYYLFCCPTPFAASIVLYTSSTPIGPWTSQGTVISLGSAGAWDSAVVAQLNLCAFVGGVYYAYYSGSNGSNYASGLATSTNLTTWTKVYGPGSTAQITGLHGTTNATTTFMSVNGVYYGWGQGYYNNAQLNNTGTKFNSIFRWSSPTPSGPWTMLSSGGNQCATYYAATASDFSTFNGTNQIADPCMVVANGNIYTYYDIGVDGGEGKVGQAVATNITPTQLVGSFEGVVGAPISGAPQLNLNTLGSDPGTGANANPIGGNWTTNPNYFALQRNSNLIEASSTTNLAGIAYWNPVTWSSFNDQWGQITAAASAAGTALAVALRQAVPAKTLYYVDWGGALGTAGTWNITKVSAGTSTVLLTQAAALTVSLGDTLLGVVNGTSIYLYYNGILIGVATDSTIAAGNAGTFIFGDATSTADAAVSAWSGGTFQAAPAPPPITVPGSGSLMLMGCGQ